MVSSAPDTSVAGAAQSQHGLTWPCLSACVWGGRCPVNPTPERLLYGTEAGSALSKLKQSCPHTPGRFSQGTDTSPWFHGISSLGFLTIETTDEVRPSSWKHSQGCVGHPWMGREKKGAQMGQMLLTSRRTHCQQEAHKTFNTTREGYWSSAPNSGLGKRNWNRFTNYREKPQSNYIFLY